VQQERIVTPRLILEPVGEETAKKVLTGEDSGLEAGAGWPHADTLDGLAMGLGGGQGVSWFVLLDGVVIGDCGTHGEPDETGDVELGYGLAAPYRGQGYGSELVAGLSRWLLGRPGVRRVVACDVLEANVASRRALERAGFELQSVDDGHVSYALSAARAPS
jgi:RimJ/RimL family protein N-acetyltransferase